jgi:phosphate:Na+ symporter
MYIRLLVLALAGSAIGLVALPALAAADSGHEVDWFSLGMGLFGGLAVFLIGLEHLSAALQAAAGERLKMLLATFTQNQLKGAFTGAFITALLNSSTVTTILVVGFVTAGVMSLTQSIGVIFGANVGSTITAQIIAFNVSQYALAMIAAGFAIRLTAKTEQVRHYGSMLTGLGMIFFGMGIIGDAMLPMRSYQPFVDLMVRMENPLLGMTVGLVFTALVNSSAATLGIAIVMASDGLITLEAGIALALGANIGTIFTTLIAAIGKPREALRAAWVHGLFNIIGPLLWVPFIPWLAEIATWLSPSHPDLEGAARMGAEVPRQIANAHTVLNVVNALVFLNFTAVFARVVTWMWPDKPVEPKKVIIEPEFLSDELLETPSLALERVRMEIGHMGAITRDMLVKIREAFTTQDRHAFEEVEKMDDQIDLLREYIIHYLGEIREQDLSEEQESEFVSLLSVTEDLESLADVIETDLVTLGRGSLQTEEIKHSETIRALMRQLHAQLLTALQTAVEAIAENDPRKAQDVLAIKGDIQQAIDEALKHQATSMVPRDTARLAGLRIEMEVLDKLERIYRLCRRIAKAALPTELLAEQTG